eukprot:9501539-Pyramimonas_sp.AAC.1
MPEFRDAWCRLRALKEVFHEAARQVKEGLSVDGPSTNQEKLSWFFAVLRAMTLDNSRVVKKAVRAYPDLCQFIDVDGMFWVNYAGFMERMRSCSQAVLEEEVKELFSTPQLSEEYKVKKAQQLQRHLQVWRARNRRIVLAGVEAPD